MRTNKIICLLSLWICLAAIPIVTSGQESTPVDEVGGPLTGRELPDAPFTADATTTFRGTLGDGTHLDLSTTARYYRDRMGRARVELMVTGFGEPRTMGERLMRTIVAPEPGSGVIVMLDSVTRAARYLPRFSIAEIAGGEGSFAVPLGGSRFLWLRRAQDLLRREPAISGLAEVTEEPLGNRQIANVETTGNRVTMRIPAGYQGHNKPIELFDERWESRELKLLIAAHSSDTRVGELDYLVTNIRRVEPPPDLVVVPPDHSFDPKDLSVSLTASDTRCPISYIPAVGIGPGKLSLRARARDRECVR
jgi:hypothetical protein